MFRPGRLHDGLGRGDRRGVDDSLRSSSVLDGASTALHSLTRDNITVFSCRLTPSPKLLIIGGESHALGMARARSCSCIAASLRAAVRQDLDDVGASSVSRSSRVAKLKVSLRPRRSHPPTDTSPPPA